MVYDDGNNKTGSEEPIIDGQLTDPINKGLIPVDQVSDKHGQERVEDDKKTNQQKDNGNVESQERQEPQLEYHQNRDTYGNQNNDSEDGTGEMDENEMDENELDEELDEELDDDDDYLLSDENDFDGAAPHDNHRMGYNATLSDHSDYLLGTLNHALDSLDLDKSLVLQAQLSGILNNENQKITEKRLQVLEKLEYLKGLFKKNFDPSCNPDSKGKVSVIGQLNQDIKNLEHRIDVLKNGHQPSSLRSMFGGGPQKINGIINRFPVEYNQAKDKVLERQLEE